MIETKERGFELVGDQVCLDFANTQHDRLDEHPRELLNSYNDLVSWSQEAQILTDSQAQRLCKEAAASPVHAAAVHKRAIVLREALFRLFSAIGHGSSPET